MSTIQVSPKNKIAQPIAHTEISGAAYPVLIHYSDIECHLQNLTEKILTIIDGAIISEKQNKAVKDQIKREIRDLIFEFQRKSSEGKSGHGVRLPDEN